MVCTDVATFTNMVIMLSDILQIITFNEDSITLKSLLTGSISTWNLSMDFTQMCMVPKEIL